MPRLSDAEDDSIEQSCPLCRFPDNSQMVSCDECRQWYHFSCVGVTEAIADHDWSCQDCLHARFPASVSQAVTQSPEYLSLVNLFARSVASVLPPVPEEQTMSGNEFPISQFFVSPVALASTISAEYSVAANQSFVNSIPQTVPVMTTAPSVPARSNLISQLPMELRLRYLEEEQILERKHLMQRYRLLIDTPTVLHPNSTIPVPRFPCSSEPIIRPCTSSGSQQRPPASLPTAPVFCNPQSQSSPVCYFGNSSRPVGSSAGPQCFPSLVSSRANVPYTRPLDPSLATNVGNESTLLNRSQIAARQAVSKDLPEYNGDPEQWPLFIAAFESTTRLCGYTIEENMMRLQKCLKGKALDAVRCQLLYPRNLESVLATLKMLFGRPEVIVHSLIQKVQLLPAPRADKLCTLVDFAIAVRNMVATLQNCNLEEHLCNISLMQNLVDRLPPMIRLNWATHRQGLRQASLAEFSAWLYTLAEAASTVTIPQGQNVADKSRKTRKEDGFLNAHIESTYQRNTFTGGPSFSGCSVCRGKCDAVENCKQFLVLDHSSRWNALREHKLCRCCLGKHQGPCKSAKVCGKKGCTFKHHRLLHNDAKDKHSFNPTPTESGRREQSSGGSKHDATEYVCNTHRSNFNSVLFQYVPVTLYNKDMHIDKFAFLDCRSSLTLLEEGLASELHLKGEKRPLCLRWTADTCRYENSAKRVSLDIAKIGNGNIKHRLTDVYTVKELKLPSQSLSFATLASQHAHLQGIPVESYENIQPRILIGMNNIRVVNPLKCREGAVHEPVAAKTRLGWMVYGMCPTGNKSSSNIAPHSFHMCHHSTENDAELNSMVKAHFALENLGIYKPEKMLLSTEDARSTELMRSVTRFENGRYRTGLLWKFDDIRFPDSRPMALRRHKCLMQRMGRDSSLADTLKAKMGEYIQKGYVRKLSQMELQQSRDRIWYLPIFPVFNPNKPNKVRIVWDAAAAVAGVSLNAVLMKGPDLLTALPIVLYRFRERPIAVSGDIAEMFLRVAMNERDQHCQRIIWCDEEGMPAEYVVTVMTFGAKCSPSCAQFIINENAARFAERLPKAVEVIKNGHYVDDMLVSVDTEEEAIKLAKDIQYIHLQGGFTMRNWISNSTSVMQALGETGKAEKSLSINDETVLEKVLGMWWDTRTDTFRFKLSTERNRNILSASKNPTKRDVLRVLMSVYDPLGLIAHYMIYLKLLFQEIWRNFMG
ncbi:uncharacterized protein LOC129726192 isoform X1 [Wyeomyia smithii]|uniref:uncharacterized protein LOC129726192 isoform X1 n=1 Tax=Wyeomyia smithii TaxID=174621 RepID=UPI002467F505|nr:uncharacterized protein LOC129726192 isoform X1 [Wyeomyia smithii]